MTPAERDDLDEAYRDLTGEYPPDDMGQREIEEYLFRNCPGSHGNDREF
jgi:hypothetical protein